MAGSKHDCGIYHAGSQNHALCVSLAASNIYPSHLCLTRCSVANPLYGTTLQRNRPASKRARSRLPRRVKAAATIRLFLVNLLSLPWQQILLPAPAKERRVEITARRAHSTRVQRRPRSRKGCHLDRRWCSLRNRRRPRRRAAILPR